jgi:hypothetical protein
MAAARSRQQDRETTRFAAMRPNLWIGSLLVLLLMAVAAYSWWRWGPAARAVLHRPLTLDRLQITPVPGWIRADVRQEAFLDGSLNGLSLSDLDATYKVYRAFELHAWVAKVDRVHKTAAGEVVVKLQYRRPVAWVEIPGHMSPKGEDGVLPVDKDAVILNPLELSARVEDFIRISVEDPAPYGMKGTVWADARIKASAQLAAQLLDGWRDLQLYRIRALPRTAAELPPQLLLVTHSNRRFIWGSAPGSERPGEASALQKLTRLKHVSRQQPADAADPIDLRVPAAEEPAR